MPPRTIFAIFTGQSNMDSGPDVIDLTQIIISVLNIIWSSNFFKAQRRWRIYVFSRLNFVKILTLVLEIFSIRVFTWLFLVHPISRSDPVDMWPSFIHRSKTRRDTWVIYANLGCFKNWGLSCLQWYETRLGFKRNNYDF